MVWVGRSRDQNWKSEFLESEFRLWKSETRESGLNQETWGQHVVTFRGQGIQVPGFWVKIPHQYLWLWSSRAEKGEGFARPDHRKVPASGLKDLDLGWVPVVWVKTGVQKLGLAVWPRGPEKQCQGLGCVTVSFLA